MENYEVVKKLGQGAMGEVLLVRRHADNVNLAMKRLAIWSEKDRQQALNESVILRSLWHPHIVRFVDSFVDGQDMCIAMELCSGGDLSTLLKVQRETQRRFPELEIRSMLAQLASALAYMHGKRVVHRDIKSSNVMLRGAGLNSERHLLLGDFGVAKALESTRAMACTVTGTPYYLPPEVCNGAAYNAKADLWSFGVLAYEICSLRLPFQVRAMAEGRISILIVELG